MPGKTIRRSVALPQELVDEVAALTPDTARASLSRVVVAALEEYAERRRVKPFEAAMERMASDPAIRRECDAISREFAPATEDGLADG